jgi:hydroxymethylpyrimidine pyrophosphatase-like HAD family hydrolase
MRYLALACDYDGTLATHGRVERDTLAALERLLESGRKLILVTGRELDDLRAIFPELHLFERVVAENGALLYRPGSKEDRLLAQPPPPAFVAALKQRGVAPVSVGRVIVATWQPHEAAVLDVIRGQGLELQVIFNKGAVMVLPAGVNKATGLAAALEEMGLSPHNAVGVGDAENDHAFLNFCQCAVAVANALPALKDKADVVTAKDHGAGVVELIDELVAADLAGREERLTRHHVLVGNRPDGSEVRIAPLETNLLIAGTSGSGKSTLATGLVERLAEKAYQFCVIDPEGDYGTFAQAVVLGTPQRPPTVEEVLQVLKEPRENLVVNLVALPFADRPLFLLQLLPRLQELRARTARPHWLVVDETHHLQPSAWEPAALALPQRLSGIVRITVDPGLIAPAALASVETVVAVGEAPENTLARLAEVLSEPPPEAEPVKLGPGEVLFWCRSGKGKPFPVRFVPGRTERRRHVRKYAEGELPPERSFYFRGADGRLNLRAQNLILFQQLADGVDDETWSHHLQLGDYSRWFREGIKDDELAADAEQVERESGLTPRDSRERIKAAIAQRYTLPATSPMPVAGTDALRKYQRDS